jgi:DNA-binding NtrC family response regulator
MHDGNAPISKKARVAPVFSRGNTGAECPWRTTIVNSIVARRPEPLQDRDGETQMENAPRVLIVEDHEVTLDALTLLFEKEGFVVHGAGSLAAAATILSEELPSIAVLDIGLPDGNGLQLLATLKAKDPKVPVIVVTASDEERFAREAVKLGAFSFIHKPYGFAALISAVRKALEGHKVTV